MERRKIQLVGGSTYSITLPKRWARHHHLEAGDEVYLHDTPDERLIISTKPHERSSSRRIETTLDGRERSFPHVVFSLYYYGFDTITLTSSTTIKPGIRKRIRRIVNSLSGTQITLESEKRVEISVLIDRTRIDVRQILHRMSLLINESIESITEGDLESVSLNEREIDRLYHLAQRATTMAIRDASLVQSTGVGILSTIPSYFMISKRLESIGDEIGRLEDAADSRFLERASTEINRAVRHLLKDDMPIFDGLGLATFPSKKHVDEPTRLVLERIWRNVLDIHASVTDISVIHATVDAKAS